MSETANKRRKKQPTAQAMRDQLAAAADEIIRLRSELADALPSRVVFCGGFIAGAVLAGWLL